MKKPKSSRHSEILAEITQSPSLRVAQLAERLGVSTETIRRDLDELTKKQLIERTYGGAVRTPSSEPSVGQRHELFVPERERIARAASARVKPGSMVMIGSGATTTHVARRIAIEHTNLTILTHSFGVATVLAINPTITVLMAPGAYLASEGETVGALTTRFFGEFSADLAILGASGVTSEGPSDALVESAEVYRTLVARAAMTMVAVDHSKFDNVFPARFASWREIGAFVCDRAPGGALSEALARHQVETVVAA
jgi:DeoR/GlpR family transcriptional regulator of sugar metabolism